MSQTDVSPACPFAPMEAERPCLPGPVQIGSVRLETNLLLAPMAGLTDKIFRRLIRQSGGCGLAFTEMVSSEALTRGISAVREIMDLTLDLEPIGVQLYGSDPGRMSEAAAMVQEEGAHLIDINMGCPARKIVHHGSGAALMRDPEKASTMVRRVADAVSVPVTVKLRLGWDDGEINVFQIAKDCQEAGAAAVTVHCRTRKEGFGQGVRWGLLQEISKGLEIPVFVNGDITSTSEARQAMEMSAARGVMIGRGALRNPWIFQQITGVLPAEGIPLDVRREFILTHYRMMSEMYPGREVKILHLMRVFTGWYTRGLMYGARLRKRISETKTPDGFIRAVEEYYSTTPPETS